MGFGGGVFVFLLSYSIRNQKRKKFLDGHLHISTFILPSNPITKMEERGLLFSPPNKCVFCLGCSYRVNSYIYIYKKYILEHVCMCAHEREFPHGLLSEASYYTSSQHCPFRNNHFFRAISSPLSLMDPQVPQAL